MLYDSIREYHFHVSVVHRDLTKQEREEMVSNFYEMFTQILITTDLKYLNEGTIPCKVCIHFYFSPSSSINLVRCCLGLFKGTYDLF